MARQTEVRKIQIKVDTQGDKQLREIAKNLGGITREVKSVSSVLQKFNTVFNTVMGASVLGVGVKGLTDMADAYQLLSNRIGVLTNGTEDVAKIMNNLTTVSSRTKNSIEDTATAYSRIVATTKDLGISAQQAILITEALQNTFRLSGATQEEATGSLIQFTQALGLGKLQGQEFRSVMLSNVTYADLLAKSMGVSRGQLQKFAEQGKITSAEALKPLIDNFFELQQKGEKMGQTFEQTITVSMNNLKKRVGELAVQFDLSGKFAKGIDWITDRLIGLGAIIVALAVSQIPTLARSVATLGLVLIRFTLANPILAFLSAIAVGMTFVFDSVKDVTNTFKDLVAMLSGPLLSKLKNFRGFLFSFQSLTKEGRDFGNFLYNTGKSLDDWTKTRTAAVDSLQKEKEANTKLVEAMKKVIAEMQKLAKATDERSGKQLLKDELAGINMELTKGVISIDAYYQKLQEVRIDKVERDWQQGRISLEQFNKAVIDVEINKLTRDLNQGKISTDQFRQSLNAIEIDELNNRLNAGAITLQQFNQEMLKFRTDALNWDTWASSIKAGITDYLESIGSVGQGIAGVTKRAFDNLSDAILQMTKKGKYDFASFTQAVLDDIARIIIQAKIIAPIAKGILNYGAAADAGIGVGDFGPVTTGNVAAKGAYFSNGASYFAKGGVVDSPTAFSFGIGKRGVMGEAGPEAILPLSRGSGGQLGVKAQVTPVVVNIINQSGAQVDQKETSGPNGEKILEVLITSKVKEGMANGNFDKTFQQLYGLRRLGY